MKKLKISIIFIAILLALAVFTSCNASEDSYVANGGATMAPEAGDSVTNEKADGETDSSKIIKNATVNSETKNFEEAEGKLKALIKEVGGNIASSNSTVGTSYYSSAASAKRANYTVKVPSESFEAFLEGLEAFLNVTYITTSTEDVTENYLSVEAKIESLEAQRKGLVEMLESVDLSKDFYTWQQIKSELAEIETQLNYYHNMLENLDKVTRYSTVYLSIEEVVELTVVDGEDETFGKEIGNAFKESFTGALEFFKGLLIVLIYLLPFFIISGGIAVLIVVLVKNGNKKRAKKAEEAAKNAPMRPAPPQQVMMPTQQMQMMPQQPPMMPPQNMPYGAYNDPNRK